MSEQSVNRFEENPFQWNLNEEEDLFNVQFFVENTHQ